MLPRKLDKPAAAKLLPQSIILLVLVIAAAVLPVFLSPYYLYLLATIYMTALLASSLNLVLGYGGLLQLHHAVFFGVGAYGTALLIQKAHWPLLAAAIGGPLAAAVTALFIGWFCVRLRGLYFGMLTLALGQLVWAVVYKWRAFTGGDDGIQAIKVPEFLISHLVMYYVTLSVLIICLVLLYIIIKSPFGLTLIASRDNPVRVESVGVNIKRHQLTAFVISAFFAGVAGVLFVLLERSVSPSLLYYSKSAEVLIMALLGGMTTFLGPTLGAAALVALSMVVGSYTDYWLLILGVILLFLVLFLPEGVLGFVMKFAARKQGEGRATNVKG